MYQRSAFSPTQSSRPTFRSDVFGTSSNLNYSSSLAERKTIDHNALPSLGTSTSDLSHDSRPAPAILIRKLPRTTSDDTLMSMLIFAGDLIDTEFIRSPYPDDQGFATAVARFRSQAGAIDAQQKLNGKPNTAKEANMVIELHSSGMAGTLERRATIDATSSRNQASSASPASSFTSRSRFGSTFQSPDKISPPLVTSSSTGSGNEFPVPDTNSHFQTLFSPQSPLANGYDSSRVSGKSVINDNGADDETGELLKDPVAYAKNGHTSSRRPTMPQIPVTRFGSLSLSTAMGSDLTSPTLSSVNSSRGPVLQAPMSPTNISNGAYSMAYPRPQYPPVNPADQNPPCNTLYVGNLPIDASEDELKAIFSKQRGYKRLCFRTKQNGPMCFVEFEDVSFATKALNELYGHPLHNSVKGGIRLSFSKNPLGVRTGQTNGVPSNGQMSPPPMNSGYSNTAASNGFSAASGPPPGLGAPPGLINGHRSPPLSTGLESVFANPFGMPQAFSEQMSPRQLSGGLPPNMTGQFGREHRASYTDYMLGR